jgi:hypothetical protein
MLKVIEVVFDGKAFVPTEPVDLPAGTKLSVSLPEGGGAVPAEPMTAEEAEMVLRGDGTPLPWATVEEALAYSRGRPWPDPDAGGRP